MARMSIDDKFLRDPRVADLADDLGISRFDAMGRLLAVFALCYDFERDTLRTSDIDRAAERPGFADAIFAADLAVIARGGMRIRGANQRIEYLAGKREAGRVGGANSALSRQLASKHPVQAPRQARGNLPDPVPDVVPDPAPDRVPDQEKEVVVAARPPRAAKAGPTPAELATVQRVLGKLGERNGVAYGGAAAHVKLIVGRLRDGLTEFELRAVIAYCCDEWLGDDEMRKYLRPETLFGPTTIAKYLDPARARYRDMLAKLAPQPTLSLDGGKP